MSVKLFHVSFLMKVKFMLNMHKEESEVNIRGIIYYDIN